MGVSTIDPGPNRKMQLVAGDRFTAGGTVFGILGAVTQRRTWSGYAGGENNTGAVSDAWQGISLEPREDNLGRDSMLTGAMINFAAQPGENHEFSLRLIANHAPRTLRDCSSRTWVAGSTSRIRRCATSTALPAARCSRERTLSCHRRPRRGGGLVQLDAGLQQDGAEPARRALFRNFYDSNNFGFRMPANSTDAQNTRRTWRKIGEDDRQLAGDVDSLHPRLERAAGLVKAGIYPQRSDRTFEQNSFTYILPQQIGSIFDPARACNQRSRSTRPAVRGRCGPTSSTRTIASGWRRRFRSALTTRRRRRRLAEPVAVDDRPHRRHSTTPPSSRSRRSTR